MDIRLDTSQAKAPAGGVRCVQNPGGTPGCVVGNIVSLYRGRFHRVFCIAVGAILLLSAALKSWQYLQSPIPPYELQHFPGLEPVLIAWETFLGLWLISGALPIASRRVAIGCFSVFGCYAFYEAVSGRASCGCFGQVHVNPWLTVALDTAMVLALIFVAGPERQGSNGRADTRRHTWPVAAALAIGLAAGMITTALHPKPVAAANGLLTAAGGKLVILEPHHWVGHRLPVLTDIVQSLPETTRLQQRGNSRHAGAAGKNSGIEATGARRLPKMPLDQRLAYGNWIIMFYHASCEECRHTIPIYENLARKNAAAGNGVRVAFVRVPSDFGGPGAATGSSADGPQLFHASPALHGTLDNSHEWFATTPMVVELHHGIVLRAVSGTSAMNRR